jgi:hypothetical protein
MKHSPSQLIALLTQFATDFKEDLSTIDQSGWPNPDITLGLKNHLNYGCTLAARRRYGVQLAINLISISHVKAIIQLDQIGLQTPQPVSRKHHSYNEIRENCMQTFSEDVSKVNNSKIPEHVKTKDELIRAKYPPLPLQIETITKMSLNDSTGLFGNSTTAANSRLNRECKILPKTRLKYVYLVITRE